MRINIKNVGQHIIDIATPLQQSPNFYSSFLSVEIDVYPTAND
jgi:hypothetical protein